MIVSIEYEPKPAKTPRQRAVELFRRGESCAFVAKTLHISEAKAAQIQDEIDPLAKRRRAAQAKAMRTERADVKTADIIQLRRQGLTEQAIGKRLGCSQKLVNKRLHKLGIHEGRVDSLRKQGLNPLAKACPRPEATKKGKRREDWKDIGTADAAQDAWQRTPFAHVGGLDKRDSLVAPWWAVGHERDYLEGYEAAALQMYGPDWRTCSFDRVAAAVDSVAV